MNQPFKNLDQGFEPDGRSTRVNDRYDPYSRPLVPEDSSGNLKTMQQGYHICILVLAFINLIFVWMAYDAVFGYSASLNDFKTNWSLKPIVDIKTGLSRCPGGYEDLIIDRWPGTSTGCDCSHAWGFYPNLQTGRCDVNETIDGCRTVSSTSSMPLNKFYSYRICAKRQGDPFNRAVRPTKMFGVTKCPGGYKICGSGEPKDQYCVTQGSPCPINSIIISDTSSSFSNTDSQIPQKNDDHYTKLNLDSGVVLAFSYSKAGGLPIVRMKLTEGGVCANPEEVGTSKGRYLYKLLRRYSSTCSTRIAGSYTDPRYELVGKVREDRLFEDNGVSYVTRNLPRYPAADERHYYWNLYVNRYFEWDPDCDSEYGLNREDFITTVEYSVDISWSLGVTLFFSVVFFIVCGILLCAYNAILNKDPGDDSYSLKNVDVGALIIKGVLILIIIWYCYSNIGVISSYNQTVDVLAQEKCSDSFTNKIFLSYSEDLYSSSGKNYLALVMSLIILATCLIYSCMVCTGKLDEVYDQEHDAYMRLDNRAPFRN